MSEHLGVSSTTGLRARDLRHLEEETQQQQKQQQQQQQQQQQKQRRRLSQNSNMTGASYTSQRVYASRQPMDRQLSSGQGAGAAAGAAGAAGAAASDAMLPRRRRAPPSNASRTSTVLSGQAASRRIRDRQDPSTASDRAKGKESERSGDRHASRSHLHADELPVVHGSPLRRWCRLVEKTSRRASTVGSKARSRSQDIREWSIALAVIVWIKWTVGLGGWSGKGHPPLFGDLEAQRHWLSITTHLPISSWYSHNLAHWGLDYPPLTAYHSYLLGRIAQLFGNPQWVGLRGVDADVHGEERAILFMRSTVIVGDLLLWALPVAGWCAIQLGRWRSGESENEGRSKRSSRTMMLAFYSIMLQPGLILIDSGHFQYNSIMLGLTLLAVLAFHSGRDSLGATLFVASMCFKQMALYYAPGIFAYLLGKCFYLGGNEGMHLFTSLGFFSVASLLIFFAPFLYPLSQLSQALTRIFPFSRGLFEDKVANVWCSLNVVIKLREIASIPTLARLSAVITLGTTMPIVLGVAWVSWQLRQGATGSQAPKNASRSPAPTITLLPYALFASSMAFFLFSFQVHEKSILLPLMPLTLLLAGKQPGLAGQDFEWIMLLNNVAAFSMYPLLKRDGLALPTVALALFWNFALGYNPFSVAPSLTKYLSLVSYFACSLVLFLESVTTAPKHLPDLYVVLNVLISCGVFGLGWLWSLKRLVEEAWGLVGLGGGKGAGNGHLSPTSASHDERRRFLSPSESEFSLYDGRIAPERGSRRTSSDGRRAASPYLPEERRERSSARSASVASSSTRTARQRPTRSPLVSPQELPNEDEPLHEPPPYTGMSSAFSRSSGRGTRGRLASTDFDAPVNGFERVSRTQQHLGDVSTHVSPSKTIVPRSREAFHIDQVMEEENRWRQGMLREFD